MFNKRAIVFLIISLIFAQRFGFDPKMGKRGYFFNIPNLTTDQMNKIEKLRLQNEKGILPLTAELREKEIELESLIKEGADNKKIDDKVKEIGKIRTEIHKRQVRHLITICNLLTNEQKAYFDQSGEQRRWECW